ncbi:hypothetical protein CRG98_045824 [Punica granatum]|uniref:CRM domain-containing protein n=1 Tax=Punica granatum TaxID=22663 RepID=A0A2I0HQE0_PUNGR|nr:hypothetical protein CRG98_045824 [Punica granatum]
MKCCNQHHRSPICPRTISHKSRLNPSFTFPFPSPPLTSKTPRTPAAKLLTRAQSSKSEQKSTVPQSAIQRIAEKLRSLGFTEDAGDDSPPEEDHDRSAGQIFIPLPTRIPKHRVGHTIDASWSTPENPVPEPGSSGFVTRYSELRGELKELKRKQGKEKREEKAPTLAELRLPEEELRRLTTLGIGVKQKLKIGKAGITEGIVNGIHERWRRAEVVKITCDDICRTNMKRTHDLLERKTGGLVVWRSGSNIILYRGPDYKYPYFSADDISGDSPQVEIDHNGDQKKESSLTVAHGEESSHTSPIKRFGQMALIQGVGSPERVRFQLPGEAQLAEEADRFLEGLGPRFTDWWGYEPLPVDADLLPAVVPGYRRPFRLLPYGVKPKLTNDEMTTLRRLGRPLPCHFALGRNRNLQGLAASIIKLWEKCEIAKIAVKRGVQNTNSEMMAEELRRLTGGTLLSRDREFIVLYRGKDFLPPAVSSAIEERRKHGFVQREKVAEVQQGQAGSAPVDEVNEANDDQQTTTYREQKKIAELQQGQAGSAPVDEVHETDDDQQTPTYPEKQKIVSLKAVIESTSMKLSQSLERKAKAEKLLVELENSQKLEERDVDREGITEEERYMLRKVGLRMRPFLLLGRRGVFDGTVENMHLHWKYRELVKLICKEKNIEAVYHVARTLEAGSGGILVSVERVSKGYAIIIYRGKNYQRPACIRPKILLSKRAAMKRSLEAQRRESLKLHVLKLSDSINELKLQLDRDKERIRYDSSDVDENNSADSADSPLPAEDDDEAGAISVESHHGESSQIEPFLPESLPEGTRDNISTHEKGEAGISPFISDHKSEFEASCSTVDAGNHTSGSGTEESLSKPSKVMVGDKLGPTIGSTKIPARPSSLSKRERLLLRKQALKMTKRPVLSIGRSNIIAGIAKAIRMHFQKHPLAIVNVKGRAKGTSIQELIFKLEQETGAVLVSQEPNKVILYRGWGAEDESRKSNDRASGHAAGKESAGDSARIGRANVSPELIAAIKMECGLQSN